MTIEELAQKLGIKLTSANRDAIAAYARSETAKVRIDGEIERTLADELASRGGNADILLPHLRGRVRGLVDTAGAVTLIPLDVNGVDMPGKTVADLVEAARRDKTLGKAFGGSAPHATGRVNPWAPETRNLTEQSRIRADNPDLADRLQRDAASGSVSSTRTATPPAHRQNNPWKKETFNLTEQSRIRAENPALADQLKREAESGNLSVGRLKSVREPRSSY